MDWELTQIPKILHVYWGGNNLSFLRYLTVTTFMRQNPDWEIRFYYPTHPTKEMSWATNEQKGMPPTTDWVPEMMRLPITKVPVNFEQFGYKNNISEVHKSDVIRLILLSTVGGLWSDMDIFYFKPISWSHLNRDKYKDIETFYCNNDYGHSIGFLMATPGNKFFAKLLELSKTAYNQHNYQTYGATLWNRHFRSETNGAIEKITPAMNIPMDVVYSHRAGDTPELLTKMFPKFNDKSIGIHWFGGDHTWREFLHVTDGGRKNIPSCIIGDLIKREMEILKT